MGNEDIFVEPWSRTIHMVAPKRQQYSPRMFSQCGGSKISLDYSPQTDQLMKVPKSSATSWRIVAGRMEEGKGRRAR